MFISDVHLGSSACQADYLLDCLRSIRCETLYLVGDIIDLLAMRKRTHWPETHTAVIEEVIRLARSGTRVVYIPGNHDAELRLLAGSRIAGVEVRRSAVHQMADGRRLLVAHGDEFDAKLPVAAWLRTLGDYGHDFLLRLNSRSNCLRRRLGLDYWPLAAALKSRLGRRYARAFELAAVREVRRRGFDGFVGGHLHVARISTYGRFVYCNDGDWVEHCTALVEDQHGKLSLLRWTEKQQILASTDPRSQCATGPEQPAAAA